MKDFSYMLVTIATQLDIIVAFINFAQGNMGKAIFFLMLAIAICIVCVIMPSIFDKDNH